MAQSRVAPQYVTCLNQSEPELENVFSYWPILISSMTWVSVISRRRVVGDVAED